MTAANEIGAVDALDAIVAEWTRARTKWDATETLQRAGIAAFPSMTPKDLDEEDRKRLENAAVTCPVHKSLHPDVQSPITFNWGE